MIVDRCTVLGRWLVVALLLPALGFTSLRAADERPLSVNDLALEVIALQAMHRFDLSTPQLRLLRKWAPDTAMPAEARPAAKVKPALRQTLVDLRAALIEGSDDERIVELETRLEELRSEEGVTLDDGVEITDSARQRTPELLGKLSARQVGFFIAAYGDQFPDPLERLTESLEEAREVQGMEWKQFREALSWDVGRLVGGLDEEKTSQVTDQVVQFLIRVRALSEEQFQAQRERLDKEAAGIVAVAGPLEIIQNEVKLALADLLSNPRLAAAAKARLKKE